MPGFPVGTGTFRSMKPEYEERTTNRESAPLYSEIRREILHSVQDDTGAVAVFLVPARVPSRPANPKQAKNLLFPDLKFYEHPL